MVRYDGYESGRCEFATHRPHRQQLGASLLRTYLKLRNGLTAGPVIRYLVWAAGAQLWPLLGLAQTPPSIGQVDRDPIARLEAEVARRPEHLGAHLDLAVALCRANEVARAQRLLLWLDAQPDVPTGILDVISWYRNSNRCREVADSAAWWPRGFWALGAGRANNLNLGPVADKIFVTGIGQELELGQASRPIEAPMGHTEAGASWDLGLATRQARGWKLGLYGQALRYRDQPNFGLNAGMALLQWSAPDETQTAAEFQMATARLTLGDGTRLAAQTLHASRLWAAGEAAWVGGWATLTFLDYAQRAALDARQLETRLRMRWEGDRAHWTADAGWLEDREVKDRPGGDRRGPFLAAMAQWAHPSGLGIEGQLKAGWTRDSRPYALALFGDAARRSRPLTGQLAFRQRLSGGWQLRLETRWAAARDSLALFTYNARSTMLTLEWAFEPGAK